MRTMHEINILGFWDRFDEARQDTIDALCKETGISNNTIRGLRSHGKLPNLADTIAIADYLKVSLDWLVLGKVVEKGSDDLNEVVTEYRKSDNLTKLLVQRTLKLI